MSQIATFYKLPLEATKWDLIQASRTRKRLFRKPLNLFDTYLRPYEISGFDLDGTWWILILEYLRKYEHIDFLSGHNSLTTLTGILSKNQGGFFSILTPHDKETSPRLKEVTIDSSNTAKLLESMDICSERVARSHIFGDTGSWALSLKMVESCLTQLDSESVILTSVA